MGSRSMVRVKVAPSRRVACGVTMAFALFAWSGPADARSSVPVTAQLDYAVAAGCPAVDAFQAIVGGRLGYQPFRDDASDRIVVRIEPAGRTLKGRIEWRQASGGSIGEQAFPSRTGDCGELARAMGFALAVQIQLMATILPEPPPPAPVAPPAPPPPPPAKPVTAVAVTRPPPDQAPKPSRAWLGGAGASAGLGMAPNATALGRLFGALAWPHFALELAADAGLPSTTRRTDGGGFSQQQFAAALAACGVRGAWSLCAVGRGGVVRVTGTGLDVRLTATGLVTQAGLRVAAAIALGRRTYIVPRAEGLVRVTQGTVLVDSTPAWIMPRFGALMGIDLALRFQ